jgi:hypothetical protein
VMRTSPSSCSRKSSSSSSIAKLGGSCTLNGVVT